VGLYCVKGTAELLHGLSSIGRRKGRKGALARSKKKRWVRVRARTGRTQRNRCTGRAQEEGLKRGGLTGAHR
jgi:hypothetical protein